MSPAPCEPDRSPNPPKRELIADPIPGLPRLSQRNKGKFPELKVYAAIKGDAEMPAHGSKDMPVWGTVFAAMARGNEAEVQMRISNLVAYVKSIQKM